METLKCSGCNREYDAVWLILHGIDTGGREHKLYCSSDCLPPDPKPANAWQWIRMQFGMTFTTTEGNSCKYIL